MFLDLDVQSRGQGSRYGHSFWFTKRLRLVWRGNVMMTSRSSLMMLKCSESPIKTACMTASARSIAVKTSALSHGFSASPLFSLPYPAYAFITTFLDDRICSVSSNLTTLITQNHNWNQHSFFLDHITRHGYRIQAQGAYQHRPEEWSEARGRGRRH